jgi:hypothetical protein
MRDFSGFTTEELIVKRKTTCEIERFALAMRKRGAISYFKYTQDRIFAHNNRVKIDEELLRRFNDSPAMDDLIATLDYAQVSFPTQP